MLNPHRFSRVWQAGQKGLAGVDATTAQNEDHEFEIIGEAVSDSDCVYDDDHGLVLSTSTAGDDDQCALFPSTAGDDCSIFRETNWGPENETEFECVIRTETLADADIYVFGLMLSWPATYDSAVDANQVVFSYLHGTDTTWQVDANIANVDVSADSGVLVVANTVYHFAIRFDKDLRAHCFINDQEVFVSNPMIAGVAWMPIVAVEAGAGSESMNLYVRSIAMARNWGVN